METKDTNRWLTLKNPQYSQAEINNFDWFIVVKKAKDDELIEVLTSTSSLSKAISHMRREGIQYGSEILIITSDGKIVMPTSFEHFIWPPVEEGE